MIEITCIEKDEYVALVSKMKDCQNRLDSGDQSARGAIAAIDEKVQTLEKDLQEMPGGYRNSQDIKHLKGRIERIEGKSSTPYLESLEVRIAQLEEIAKVMSKSVDTNTATMKAQREEYHDHIWDLRVEVEGGFVKLHESNEQRKMDIKSAWKSCNETTDLLNKARADVKTNGDKLNDHLVRTMNGTLDVPVVENLSKRVATVETCCKNVVAAGKETEKRVDFLESQGKNHSVRLDNHAEKIEGFRTNIQRVVRDILKSL